jgi:tetratricopeptide (TPR) repeat protein
VAKQEIPLNHVFLKNRITELGIKQWWLAEQVGVDRKTVIRWIQGQVRSIQQENAKELAKILSCDVSQLTVANGVDQFATPQDQKQAASLLVSSSLVDKLGPIGEWNVIESLLKATVVPNLPLNVLGDLYNQLTIASWRQNKIDQAAEYNAKSEEIALKTGDKELSASALLSKANIYSWRGQTAKAIATYRECLSMEKFIEPRALGSINSNLGTVLYESGELVEGEQIIKKSIEIFEDAGNPTNLSIAHCHLAMILLQKKVIDLSEHEAKVSIRYADENEYRRGQQMGKLILAEVEATRGNKQAALDLVESALAGFSKLGIREGLNFEYAGRVNRIVGNFNQSIKYLSEGIAASQAFPIYLAALQFELARTSKKMGSRWEEAANTAIALYEKHECPARVEKIKKEFGII